MGPRIGDGKPPAFRFVVLIGDRSVAFGPNLVAQAFGFGLEDLFGADPEERANPRIRLE
jgi:hypothetical protein